MPPSRPGCAPARRPPGPGPARRSPAGRAGPAGARAAPPAGSPGAPPPGSPAAGPAPPGPGRPEPSAPAPSPRAPRCGPSTPPRAPWRRRRCAPDRPGAWRRRGSGTRASRHRRACERWPRVSRSNRAATPGLRPAAAGPATAWQSSITPSRDETRSGSCALGPACGKWPLKLTNYRPRAEAMSTNRRERRGGDGRATMRTSDTRRRRGAGRDEDAPPLPCADGVSNLVCTRWAPKWRASGFPSF